VDFVFFSHVASHRLAEQILVAHNNNNNTTTRSIFSSMNQFRVFAVATVLLCALSFNALQGANAFCAQQKRVVPTRTQQLYLLPTQGNQLIAASSSAYDNEHQLDENEHHHHHATTTGGGKSSLATARAFVAAVFSRPASLLHPHPAKETFSVTNFSNNDDEVVFPITGFQYVRDRTTRDGHCRVLPTVGNPSCRLNNNSKKQEVVFGWYSPACRLNLMLEDEIMYASHPLQTSTTNTNTMPMSP
jgi:hypothetical protein